MDPIHTKDDVIRYIEEQADNLKIRGHHSDANELNRLADAVREGTLPNYRPDTLPPSYWMKASPRIHVIRNLFPERHCIRRTNAPNPKKPVGSPRHQRVELYRTSKTVGDYLASGGVHLDLWWDVRDRLVEVFAPSDATDGSSSGA